MPGPEGAARGRRAPDGSPYPDRGRAGFERDVRTMFGQIARGYDWFDHVASLGGDLLWRPRALWDVDRFRDPRPVRRILDVGCGTGDLTRLAARHYPGARVVGLDFARPMLEVARERTPAAATGGRIAYGEGSVNRLPFPDATFDLAMSAFVARNLPDLAGALRELYRVLGPGGTLLTLEITEPSSPFVRATFHAYFDRVVPWLGAAVGKEGPYRYLPESLRYLPPRERLMGLFREAGFSRVGAVPQSAGIVTAYLAASAAPGTAVKSS